MGYEKIPRININSYVNTTYNVKKVLRSFIATKKRFVETCFPVISSTLVRYYALQRVSYFTGYQIEGLLFAAEKTHK